MSRAQPQPPGQMLAVGSLGSPVPGTNWDKDRVSMVKSPSLQRTVPVYTCRPSIIINSVPSTPSVLRSVPVE